MSKQTTQTPQRAVFGPFGGIDTRTPHTGTPSAADILNFRLGEDGSLVKREGCHHLKTLDNYIRAVWSGKLFDESYTLLLVGSSVIRLNTVSWETSLIGTVVSETTSSESPAQFFFYRDRLYLLDGEQLYQIQKTTVEAIEAYVPLIGKDWPTTYVGEIFEARNLLTKRARIHYLIDDNYSVFLRTAYSVEAIDELYVNDELRPPMEYSYDEPTKSIIMQDLVPGDRVRVHLRYAWTKQQMANGPLGCSRVEIFGDTHSNRLFFWNGANKNVFYPSTYVSEERLADCRTIYPNSVPLYVPEHADCVIGDGRYDITGFVRQYDRLLIFAESETFMTTTDVLQASDFSAKPINPLIGCAATDACTIADNSPFTVGTNGIYRWTADTDEYSESNAYSICEPIRPLLHKQFFQYAKTLYRRAHNEIWFYAPELDTTVWIYRLSDGAWYRFTLMDFTQLFEIGGKLFLCYYNELCAFDETYLEDIDPESASHEIVAEFHSNLLEYGTHKSKHFSGLTLRGDCDGGAITVRLVGDGLGAIDCRFSEEAAHSATFCRLSSGRFRYATLQITAGGTARQTIHSLISDVR